MKTHHHQLFVMTGAIALVLASHPVQGKVPLDPLSIEKYVTPLVIPPVLYDDEGVDMVDPVEIAFREIVQQVLPPPFPPTTLWAYGNPKIDGSFNNPSFTIEVTKDTLSRVKWINGLVDAGNNYLQHIIQDSNGVPIIDQTLHWAAPNGGCKPPEDPMAPVRVKDCVGTDGEPYRGPIPMVTHVHGAHVGPGSDGKFIVMVLYLCFLLQTHVICLFYQVIPSHGGCQRRPMLIQQSTRRKGRTSKPTLQIRNAQRAKAVLSMSTPTPSQLQPFGTTTTL